MAHEEGYVYFTDAFRVKRLDRLSLICEEQKEVINPKTKEARIGWVQVGGYYGSWQAVYNAFAAHMEEKVPVTGPLKDFVKALGDLQATLDALLVQGQMMTALEVPPSGGSGLVAGITADERIRLAILAHTTKKPFACDPLSSLPGYRNGQATTPQPVVDEKPTMKRKRSAKVEVATPPVTPPQDDAEDEWL